MNMTDDWRLKIDSADNDAPNTDADAPNADDKDVLSELTNSR